MTCVRCHGPMLVVGMFRCPGCNGKHYHYFLPDLWLRWYEICASCGRSFGDRDSFRIIMRCILPTVLLVAVTLSVWHLAIEGIFRACLLVLLGSVTAFAAYRLVLVRLSFFPGPDAKSTRSQREREAPPAVERRMTVEAWIAKHSRSLGSGEREIRRILEETRYEDPARPNPFGSADLLHDLVSPLAKRAGVPATTLIDALRLTVIDTLRLECCADTLPRTPGRHTLQVSSGFMLFCSDVAHFIADRVKTTPTDQSLASEEWTRKFQSFMSAVIEKRKRPRPGIDMLDLSPGQLYVSGTMLIGAEMFAIAHEGAHVLWHGFQYDGRRRSEIRDQVRRSFSSALPHGFKGGEWSEHWADEIYADVVGAELVVEGIDGTRVADGGTPIETLLRRTKERTERDLSEAFTIGTMLAGIDLLLIAIQCMEDWIGSPLLESHPPAYLRRRFVRTALTHSYAGPFLHFSTVVEDLCETMVRPLLRGSTLSFRIEGTSEGRRSG